MDIAILDTSATAHMPDVLEMPYRPVIVGAGEPGAKPHTYRLGGMTCLAGDVIGDYSFDRPLAIGDKLVFLDMAHYTMVKTTHVQRRAAAVDRDARSDDRHDHRASPVRLSRLSRPAVVATSMSWIGACDRSHARQVSEIARTGTAPAMLIRGPCARSCCWS